MEPQVTYQYNSQYAPPPPPPRQDNPLMQSPGTFGFIAICVAVFAMMYGGLDLSPLAMWPENPMPWMFITSIFLHASLDHLFWNMFMLFMFGMALEKIIKTGRFIALFLIAGMVGNIGYVLFCIFTGSDIPAIGASGALYGIFACLTILYPNMKVYLLFMVPMKIIHVLMIYAAVDIIFLSLNDNIAHSAHLAGLVVGLIFGLYLKSKYEVKPIIQYRKPRNYFDEL